jgi:hypothetical protein
MCDTSQDQKEKDPPSRSSGSPVKKTKKTPQHLQLRALLFNRLGVFDISSSPPQDKADPAPSSYRRANSSALSSQQHLKSSSSNSSGNTARKPRRLIRFNSIVSVVGIPTRSQYSNSIRHLLWGKGSHSFGSDDEEDCYHGKDADDDIETTARTQDDDPVRPEPSGGLDTSPSQEDKKVRRPRLVRKYSFHS